MNYVSLVRCTQKPGIKKHRIFGVSRLWEEQSSYQIYPQPRIRDHEKLLLVVTPAVNFDDLFG